MNHNENKDIEQWTEDIKDSKKGTIVVNMPGEADPAKGIDVTDLLEPTLYPVMEIFSSIQGEGSMLGMPVTFIRLAGCNLKCPWCDTKESWTAEGDKVHLVDAKYIADKCDKNIVVITGGEPCMNDLTDLITVLHVMQKFVCIETNATLPTPEAIDWVVASPKPPEYLIHNQCFFNELKYVVDDNFDPETCVPDAQKKTCGSVWVQPCDFGKKTAEQRNKSRASTMKCVRLALTTSYLRVGIQLHKILDVK